MQNHGKEEVGVEAKAISGIGITKNRGKLGKVDGRSNRSHVTDRNGK